MFKISFKIPGMETNKEYKNLVKSNRFQMFNVFVAKKKNNCSKFLKIIKFKVGKRFSDHVKLMLFKMFLASVSNCSGRM